MADDSIVIKLTRNDGGSILPTPWGFRIHGGKDFSHHLTVLRVTPGTVAAKSGLWSGDTIRTINGKDVQDLMHIEAQTLIKAAGNDLEIVISRGENEVSSTTSSSESPREVNSEQERVPSPLSVETNNNEVDDEHKVEKETENVTVESSVESKSSVDVTDDGMVEVKVKRTSSIFNSDSPTGGIIKTSFRPTSPIDLEEIRRNSIDREAEGIDVTPLRRELPREASPTQPYVPRRQSHEFRQTIPSWHDPRPEPIQGRTMKLLQAKLSIDSESSPPDVKISPDSTTRDSRPKPKFASATLQLLQEEEKAKSREKQRPPSETFDGGPVIGHTMKVLQERLKAGGDNPLPSMLSPEYSRKHARPLSWSSQNSDDTPRRSPDSTTGPTVDAVPVERKPRSSSASYNYFAALGKTSKDHDPEPVQRRPKPAEVPVGLRLRQRNSLDTTGCVGESKVFDTWTGMWKKPEPAPKGTYEVSDRAKPTPKAPDRNKDMVPVVPPPTEQPKPAVDVVVDVVTDDEKGPPVCASCNEEIKGTALNAAGKSWCPDHLVCNYCKIRLVGIPYMEEAGNVYCKEDYELLFAAKCANCNESITGNATNAIGKSFHPECFVCAKCKKPFDEGGFMLEKGEPYCHEDYDELFALRCGKCNEAITGGDQYVDALGKEWHVQCFSCSVCDTQLEGSKFFVVNGVPYCETHKSGH